MLNLKPGQSVRHRGRWATLNYLVHPGNAIITYDDDATARVLADELRPWMGTNAVCAWCGQEFWLKQRRADDGPSYCCHNHNSLHWNYLHREVKSHD